MFRSLNIYKEEVTYNLMKILQEKSREYNGKPYFKFKINLPEDLLEKSGFQPGDELEAEAKKGEIKLRRK